MLLQLLSSVAFAAAPASAPNSVCGATSAPISTFQLLVQREGAGAPIPLRFVKRVQKGDKILYKPGNTVVETKREPRVTILTALSQGDKLSVLDIVSSASPAEWTLTDRAAVIVFAFGPQGLDEKKVTNLATADKNLIAQISSYAVQTGQAEDGLDLIALSESDAPDDDSEDPLPARASATDRMLYTLVRTLNPSAGFDPLGGSRRAPIVSLKDKAIDGFFDNAGGMMPGGGILPEVKTWLFPETEFRSVYSQASADSMTLCAKPAGPPGRNIRVVYVWAKRLADTGAPPLALARDVSLPLGLRSNVTLKLNSAADGPLVERIRDWGLQPKTGGAVQPLRVMVNARGRGLEIDLRKAGVPPGAYTLVGSWDWERVPVAGVITVAAIDELKSAKVVPESQDRLVQGSGWTPVDITGGDFQFVDRVSLKRASGRHALSADLDWKTAPNGVTVDVDSDSLKPGEYLLGLTLPSGAVRDVPFSIYPPNPKFENLPLKVNAGQTQQEVVLRGHGLERLDKLEAPNAAIELKPADPARPNERAAVVRLAAAAKPGDWINATMRLAGVQRALPLAAAMQVAGPKPKITAVKVSLPGDLGVALGDGELPAGSQAGFAIRAENLDARPSVTAQCGDAKDGVTFRLGEKRQSGGLESTGAGALFLSLDPGAAGPSGCQLSITLTTEAGVSDPAKLGKTVRLPRIESFRMTDEKLPDGNWVAQLRGSGLETIEKTGWDAQHGLAVDALPAGVGSDGQRQSLKIAMPWPSPSPRAPLFIWLRGESHGRATKAK